MEGQQENGVAISIIVVTNFIWWMVMIAAIGLGIMHFYNCPVQPTIPIYLIVLGVSSLVALTLTYIQNSTKERSIRIVTASCCSLLHIFSFFWFIVGTTWVYAIYPPSYSPADSSYCQRALYLFAFYITTLTWFIVFLMFLFGSVFLLLACCKLAVGRERFAHMRGSSYGTTGDFQEPGAAGP